MKTILASDILVDSFATQNCCRTTTSDSQFRIIVRCAGKGGSSRQWRHSPDSQRQYDMGRPAQCRRQANHYPRPELHADDAANYEHRPQRGNQIHREDGLRDRDVFGQRLPLRGWRDQVLPPVPGKEGGVATGIWGYVHFVGSGSKPPLLFDCHIVGNERQSVTASQAAFVSIDSLGAVIWNTLFDGSQVPPGNAGGGGDGMSGAGIHLSSPQDWTTRSTMGTLDDNGVINVYFEDCHLYIWGQADVDNDGRLVVRKSIMNGTSWQTHGFTSTTGGRHVELYDNDFINTVNNRNFNRYFWLRAGTVLFTDNSASNQNTGYGTPKLLDIGDNTNPSGSYPIARAPGTRLLDEPRV